MPGTYDIFFSHASSDNWRLQPVLQALREAGLKIWYDENELADFESISRCIKGALANSKVLLAYYSTQYPLRRACQWELTAAFLAAACEGSAPRRVVLINPEPTFDHIHPVELRDARIGLSLSNWNKAGVQSLVSSIKDHVLDINGPLADVQTLMPPRWFGTRGVGSTRFVGRLRELWQLHSQLHATDFALITGAAAAGSGVAQVTGLGGTGKSLLAEEYALRFGAAYPGGIFWLRAYGNDDAKATMSVEEREVERESQMHDFARALGLSVGDKSPAEIEGAIASKIEETGKPCLWVVDDLPSGLDRSQLTAWFAPHPLAKTLITTRSREYQSVATQLDLGVLEENDAYNLFTFRRQPHGDSEVDAARSVIRDVGCYALALDIAGARIAALAGIQSFAEFRDELRRFDKDILEVAAAMSDILPNGHERSIASTLLRSIRLVSAPARDFLMLASVLAVAPITARLVVNVFQEADRLSEEIATERATRALQDCERLSLIDKVPTEEGQRAVHTLVTRAVRARKSFRGFKRALHQWRMQRRTSRLRLAAVKVLSSELFEASEGLSAHPAVIAMHDAPHARELATRITELPDPELLRFVASYDYARGAFASAVNLDKRAYEVYCRRYGLDHPTTLAAMRQLFIDLIAQGELDKAVEMAEEAIQLHLRVFGEKQTETLDLLQGIATLFEFGGALTESEDIGQRVLEAQRQSLGERHLATLTSMNNLGITLWRQAKFEEAAKINQRILEIAGPTLGENHFLILRVKDNLAQAWVGLGNVTQACKLHEETLPIRRSMLGREHPDTSIAAYSLYATYLKLNEKDQAQKIMDLDLSWLVDQDPANLGWYQRIIREALITGTDITTTIAQRKQQEQSSTSDAAPHLSADAANNSSSSKESNRRNQLQLRTESLGFKRALQSLPFLYHKPYEVRETLQGLSRIRTALTAVVLFLITLPAIALFTLPWFFIENTGLAAITSWAAACAFGTLNAILGSAVLYFRKELRGELFAGTVALTLSLAIGWSLAYAVIESRLPSDLAMDIKAMLGFGVMGISLCVGAAEFVGTRNLRKAGWWFACLIGFFYGLSGAWYEQGILARVYTGIVLSILVAVSMIAGFLRLYYFPFHFLFLWPKVRGSLYRWHPVSWDHLCLTPFPALDRLLTAYAEYDRPAAEQEIERLIGADSGQAYSAIRARVALLTQKVLRPRK